MNGQLLNDLYLLMMTGQISPQMAMSALSGLPMALTHNSVETVDPDTRWRWNSMAQLPNYQVAPYSEPALGEGQAPPPALSYSLLPTTSFYRNDWREQQEGVPNMMYRI